MSASDLPEIGVGMLGYGFMGKAHSNAYRTIAYMTWPPPLAPRLVAIYGRIEAAVAEAARPTGVKHMCAFNYRFVPAVRLARQLVDAGEIGDLLHFRGRYLQEWGADPTLDAWCFDAEEAGGTLGDTGAHVISTSPAFSRVRSPPSRASCARSFPDGRWMTRSPRASSSKAARSARSRLRA